MAEETLYDSEAMRRFAGIELGDDRIPDETTILNFRQGPGEELTVDLIGDLTGILSVVTTSESIRIAAELSKLQQVHQELSGRTRKATPKGLWCRVLLYKYIGCGSRI